MEFSGLQDASRWLEISAKLLAARDLVGCKRFADRAVESDPLLPGADELLAIADVLLSSQSQTPNQNPNPYSILQLTPAASAADIAKSYRRLALLLSPNRNPHPGADSALRLVTDAFHALNQPDKSGSSRAAAPANNPSSSFWTTCPSCCYVHQYGSRSLLGRALRCPNENCGRAFVASEVASPPPVVPGTDMYYCAWGFYPLGFPKVDDLSADWKPFHPMFPWSLGNDHKPPSSQPAPMNADNNNNNGNRNGNGNNQFSSVSGVGGGRVPGNRIKKTTARKKVGAGMKRRGFSGVESGIEPEMLGPDVWAGGGEEGNARAENAEAFRGININEEVKAPDGGGAELGAEDDMVSFHLDVDATDELLGNLQNLPFLREEEIPGRML